MANTRFTQFLYTKHGKPTIIDLDIPIGATGAVGTVVGAGIKSVTRLVAGVYQINFSDNYNKYLGLIAELWSPVSGSNVAVTAITPTVVYTITVLGTTTTAQWVTAGVPVGITPAVGVTFAAAATSAGTGQVKVQGVSTIANVEVIGNPNTTISPIGLGSANGYIIIQTLAATSSSVTTFVATDPANGSTLSLAIYFSDTSNTIPNVG